MPAIARGSNARSRRRNRSPSPTQDGIEEADTTQRSKGDDVEDDVEEQQPRRGNRAKSVKAERAASTANGASGSRRRQANGVNGAHEESASQNGDAEQEEDEDDIINVDNFGDHPLLRADASRISGMATNEWAQLERNVMTSMKKLVKEIGVVFADSSVSRGDISEDVN